MKIKDPYFPDDEDDPKKYSDPLDDLRQQPDMKKERRRKKGKGAGDDGPDLPGILSQVLSQYDLDALSKSFQNLTDEELNASIENVNRFMKSLDKNDEQSLKAKLNEFFDNGGRLVDAQPPKTDAQPPKTDARPPKIDMPPRPAGAARAKAGRAAGKADAVKDVLAGFKYTPREIRDYLDRYVISQDEAKKVLATTVCDHYNHVRRCINDPSLAERDYAKHNVIMIGPTGVGKTHLMRCLSRLIGVPFVKADATKFSETGYVGYDVEDLVRDLVKAADGNANLAQYGIIYLDEIDKIAGRGASDSGRDVSGRGVQVNLLKLMENTDVKLVSQLDMLAQMQNLMSMRMGEEKPSTISTKYILFIVSGAFDRLAAAPPPGH